MEKMLYDRWSSIRNMRPERWQRKESMTPKARAGLVVVACEYTPENTAKVRGRLPEENRGASRGHREQTRELRWSQL